MKENHIFIMEQFLTNWSSSRIDSTEFEMESIESRVELPYVLKNRRLIGPGVHNSYEYTNEVLAKIYGNTPWDKQSRALFFDHVDMSRGGGARTWIGEVQNERLEADGSVWGDLHILDKQAAINLEYGAKFGISAKVDGQSNGEKKILDGIFANWSLVFVPADKSTYLNFEEIKMSEEDKKVLDTSSVVSKEDLDKLTIELEESKARIKELEDAKPKPAKVEEKVEEKPAEEVKEEKTEEKAPEAEAPKAEAKELSDAEIALLFADDAFRAFAGEYLKEKEGRTLQEAAKQWKIEGKADKSEVKELQAKVEKLELQLSPERKTVKDSSSSKDLVAELSDKEIDKAMAEHVFAKRYSRTW